MLEKGREREGERERGREGDGGGEGKECELEGGEWKMLCRTMQNMRDLKC